MHLKMSSTPINTVPRNKTNLSVASLINCSTNNRMMVSDKEIKEPVVCTCGFETLSRNIITTVPIIVRSLPTVANTELLYKTISTPVLCSSSNQIPQLAPARLSTATAVVRYDIKQLDSSGAISSYSMVDPITHMKSLTNSVSVQSPKLDIPTKFSKQQNSHANQTYFDGLNPKPPDQKKVLNVTSSQVSTNPHNVVFTNKVIISTNNSTTLNSSRTIGDKFQAPVYMKQNAVGIKSMAKVVKVESKSNLTKSPVLNGPKLNTSAVFVPRGWNRLLEKGKITYTSPNKSRIRCFDDLLLYLQSDSTCKCGLECPLKANEVFNFNANVPSKFGFSANPDPNRVPSCSVCKKFEEMFPPAIKLRIDGRGRKPGVKIKRRASAEEVPNPDRKKMLLTGASPLEMFQSGMDAINSLSSAPFRTLSKSVGDEQSVFNSSSVAGVKGTEKLFSSQPKLLHSQSLPGGSLSTILATSTATVTTTVPMSPTTTLIAATTGLSNYNAATASVNHEFKSDHVDMPFPKSLMGEIKRSRKPSSRGRGRGSVIKSPEEMTLPKKKPIKKPLPDAVIKKASELQLSEYLQHASYVVTNKTTELIPSLKPIIVSNQQILTNQGLLSTEGKTTAELKEIYKHLQAAVYNQQLQNATAYGKTTLLVSSTGQPIAINSVGNTSAKLNTTPPPNRTITSLNELPAALRNQLSSVLPIAKSTSATPSSSTASLLTVSKSQNEYRLLTKTVDENMSEKDNKKSASTSSSTNSSNTSTSQLVNNLNSQLVNNSSNNQPVNRPLHNLNISSNIVRTNQVQSQAVSGQQGQQMVLVQFVSQNNANSKTGATKVNPPIVRAYPMAHQQAYVHTQGQSKFLVMGKGNASQALQTLAIQTTPPNGPITTTQNGDSAKRALQIQGVIPSQLSTQVPTGTHVPVQYVTNVNRPAFPMQYISASKPNQTSYVYPASSSTTVARPVVSNMTGNFVRIAPAMQPPSNLSHALEQEKKKKELEMLASMQEQLRRDTVSHVPPDVMSKASSFLNSIALGSTKITAMATKSGTLINTTATPTTTSVLPVKSSPMTIADYMKAVGMGSMSSSSTNVKMSVNTSVISTINQTATTGIFSSLATVISSITSHPNDVISAPRSKIAQSQISTNRVSVQSSTSLQTSASGYDAPVSCSTVSHITQSSVISSNGNIHFNATSNSSSSSPTQEVESTKSALADEMTLHCDEKSSDLLTSSDDSKNQSPKSSDDSKNQSPKYDSLETSESIHHGLKSKLEDSNVVKMSNALSKILAYSEGDLVWVQISGYPAWPGKVISHIEAKKPKLEDDKLYVSWFGSNQIHTVSVSQCKSFNDGFKGLDKNLTKRGYRANKKQLNDLEKAVAEALEESERRQNSQTKEDRNKRILACEEEAW